MAEDSSPNEPKEPQMQTSDFQPHPMLRAHCSGEECCAGTSEECETPRILM